MDLILGNAENVVTLVCAERSGRESAGPRLETHPESRVSAGRNFARPDSWQWARPAAYAPAGSGQQKFRAHRVHKVKTAAQRPDIAAFSAPGATDSA